MAGQPAPNSNPWFWFECGKIEIQEPGLPPTTIIEADKDFEVKVEFEFGGMLAPWIMGLGAQCDVHARYESLGQGPEGSLGPVTVTTIAGQLNYRGKISVPAGTVPVGTYKTTGTVLVKNSPVAGYIDGPILQIIPQYP